MTLEEFLARLGSKAPVPGGGSVAALTGALAAALAAMVCHLTIGKKRYAEHEAELTAVLAEANRLQGELAALIDADVAAFETLSAAYGLPRETDAEKAARDAALQSALGPATEVPLRIAEQSAAVLDLAPIVARKGSVLAVSDAAMAAVLGSAALRSAALNVWINLGLLTDPAAAAAARARLEAALVDRVAEADALFAEVAAQLGSGT